VTAVFAGLLTKVGVYAIIRTQLQLFPDSDQTLLLVIAGFTMVVGVLGAIAQDEIKRILSFHIVSQIGYMVLGVAIGGVAAIAATIFFIVHQIPIKTSLFLVDGMVERSAGTSRLERLSGLAHESGFLALLFLLPALSLSGIPPFSGFVAKLGLVTAGFDGGERLLVIVAIVCSLLTLVSMTKIWVGAFWGPRRPSDDGPPSRVASTVLTIERPTAIHTRWPVPMVLATGTLVAVGVVLAVAAGPIYELCERAAADLVHPATAVVGGR
jgi:multicomponent Na+:H+ antiporter subunit D